MSVLDEAIKFPEWNGRKKGDLVTYYYTQKTRNLSKLYKIQGFYEQNGEWFISFSRVNKRTLKIGNKTAIMVSMSYKSFIDNMPTYND